MSRHPSTKPDPVATDWHHLTVAEVAARLTSDPGQGLTPPRAAARLAEIGPNRLPMAALPGWPALFFAQFTSPLVLLLAAAGALAFATGDVHAGGFIYGVLLVNAMVGTIQERSAARSAAALNALMQPTALAIRGGAAVTLDAADLVPGDLLPLESGIKVPADLRVISAAGLLVDEASLTGESLPLAKDPAPLPPPAAGAVIPLAERACLMFAGTAVLAGRGLGMVVATGANTELGRIAGVLARIAPPDPPLIDRLRRLARQIALVTLGSCLLLGAGLALGGMGLAEVFLLMVALAVAAIPEALPIAVTVALAAGSARMARRNVIVRRLAAIEGLGSCNLIATDKTGTLTENRLSVAARDPLTPDGDGALTRAAWLASEAGLDAVDQAIRAIPGAEAEASAWRTHDRLPYEPALRLAASRDQAPDGTLWLHVKGAPEALLPRLRPGTGFDAARISALAAAGARVLMVAGRPDPAPAADGPLSADSLTDLLPLGLIALADPIRPEVPDAVAACRRAGVRVVMVTGDHPLTACAIARTTGILPPEADGTTRDGGDGVTRMVTGGQIAAARADGPAALDRLLADVAVIARADPQQKLWAVESFRRSGAVVAVTGDGVNDAAALAAADIGVAMGKGGTQVARDAADLVLSDDHFASIVAGIAEGRVVRANVARQILLMLACGIAGVATVALAGIAGLPTPLLAVQLLWLNLVTHGIQDVALAYERGDGRELLAPPLAATQPLISPRLWARGGVAALYMAVATVGLYAVLLVEGESLDSARTGAVTLMVLFQNVYVLAIRTERSLLTAPPTGNPGLLGGVGLALGLHVLAMHWPPLARLVDLTPLPGGHWALLLALALGLWLLTEFEKRGLTKNRAL